MSVEQTRDNSWTKKYKCGVQKKNNENENILKRNTALRTTSNFVLRSE
jgi:hypothetical protein